MRYSYKILTLLCLVWFWSGAVSGAENEDKDKDPGYTPVIIRFDAQDDLAELESEGSIVLRQRDDLALVLLRNKEENDETQGTMMKSHSAVRRAVRHGGISRIEKARKAVPAMDKAREWYDADNIGTGAGLSMPYDGDGVVVGFCDIGFDPNHINFKDAGGNNRIARIVQYREFEGVRKVVEGAKEYREWLTDNSDETHATHVCGILSGSYKANGYYGTAPGAEIVATVSQLSDVGLLAGVEDVIDYARSQGKPAVINLSMGNYVGPHDGTSLFSQYIAKLGREAIICLSAGNAGNSNNTLPVDFTSSRGNVEVRLANYQWTQFEMYGMTDLWGRDATPYRATLCIYDEIDRCNVAEFEMIDFSQTESRLWSSDGETEEDKIFAEYYTGAVELCGEINPDNNRYHVWLEYDAKTEIESTAGPWARYNLAIKVEADPGTHVDFYADGQYTFLKAAPGTPSPSPKLSMSDLVTGDNVIAVGMYNSREFTPLINGSQSAWSDYGHVNVNSGYATLIDGRVLPHTVAPGNPIVSSYSTQWVNTHQNQKGDLAHESVVNGVPYYWKAGGGTSMSSPYVAGYIATWLQANPALDFDDVMGIILETNRHDYPDASNPRHGHGWFDPLAGLKLCLLATSGPDIEADTAGIRLTFDGRVLTLWNPGGQTRVVDVTGLDGRIAQSVVCREPVVEMPLTVPPGIYIAKVRNSGASLKVAVK